MLEDLDEDTHLCIKCSRTIVGLENYVRHRKSHCNKNVSSASALNREIDPNHSYRSFEFTEPPSVKHDKQFNFNYEIESVHPDHVEDVVSTAGILPSPMHQSEKVASDYKTDPNKSLSESYDYNYGLGADVFFSSLNLQSSSKLKTQTVATNVSTDGSGASSLIKGVDKMLQRKQSDPGGLSHSEHMDDWINTGASTSGTDKLMKAVNAISGNKKHVYDSPQYNYEFTHGSPTEHHFDDDDDEIVEDLVEDVDIPPHTHTGGKWKPSERNHRSMHTASRW